MRDTSTIDEPGMYVIVRTESAGAFAGELLARPTPEEVQLRQARRLWFWDGAASLSELAVAGTSKPDQCKFPAPVDILVRGVLEIITATPEARASIEAVPVWTARK